MNKKDVHQMTLDELIEEFLFGTNEIKEDKKQKEYMNQVKKLYGVNENTK
jgi:hypothetical protein